jgi:succinate-semialdehyde dehydrogenase/glutarate-semialdehyde dehydrogenase
MQNFESISPVDGTRVFSTPAFDEAQVERCLVRNQDAAPAWAERPVAERAGFLRKAAGLLRQRRDELARLATREMGKPIAQALAEVDKCALVCDHYADHGADYLADEIVETDAARSLVAYQPLGTILGVMPWNFPFWQVFRYTAPGLVAGNTTLLKHASNVSRCALAIETILRDAGVPDGVFVTLLVPSSRVNGLIADERIAAVTLTGSEPAGRAVGAAAGAHLKKTVLELGGSDPFIVLDDADLEKTAACAVTARYQNCGQSCIAAKRFIVTPGIHDRFLEAFRSAVSELKPADPMDPDTRIGPMARTDLRDELHRQVSDAVHKGARVVIGGEVPEGPGAWYPPSILADTHPGMKLWAEEVFGPVAVVIRAGNEAAAVAIANASRFGLGGSVWTRDPERGEAVARRLACGAAFVNTVVKSDPRLPFGGIKASGYGRELSRHGLREFVNAKTVWAG